MQVIQSPPPEGTQSPSFIISRWILIIELAPRSVEALVPGQGWLTGGGALDADPAPAIVAMTLLLLNATLMVFTPCSNFKERLGRGRSTGFLLPLLSASDEAPQA